MFCQEKPRLLSAPHCARFRGKSYNVLIQQALNDSGIGSLVAEGGLPITRPTDFAGHKGYRAGGSR
jgi:hypothetical protein